MPEHRRDVLFVCIHNAGRSQMAFAPIRPFYPGTHYVDRKLDDPASQGVDAVRPIRDEIERFVQSLLAEPVPATT